MKRRKNAKAFLIIGFVLTVLVVTPVLGAIPASERAALIALYNSTNGDSWDTNTNWKDNNNEPDGFSKIGTEGTWHGITVSNNHVTKIQLAYESLSGTLPAELGNLGNLEVLDLKNNYYLGGTIPPELGNLVNLQELNFYDCQLSGLIPAELGNLTNLERMDLSWNSYLVGTIPPELGNLSKLEYLNLEECNLSGNIPKELGNLSNLETLNLEYNSYISGGIPSELGNLGNLKYLDMSDLNLSGTIPSSIGNLTNLESLDLGNNGLTGSIPSALGNLNKVTSVNLSNNGLTGAIPYSLTNMSSLYSIDIDSNGLYTNNETLRDFLNSRAWSWYDYQTVAPGNVQAEGLTASSVRLSWTRSSRYGVGYYLVYYGTAPGGPWTYKGKTTSGSSEFYDVTGLNFGTTYYFVVKARKEKSKVTITSDYSDVASGTPTNVSPQIGVNRTHLNFVYIQDSYDYPDDQTFSVFPGVGTINWTASSSTSWIYLYSPTSGLDSGTVTVDVSPYYLAPGKYTGAITVSDSNASNSPVIITVNLTVYEEGKTTKPFGEFSTPLEGPEMYGSIPVTGWALDDMKVANVKIYMGEPNNMVYIDDAVFIEGARADVEQAYPEYPYNYKAGWGYMLLTNFLPNNGNGTYKLHAIATDVEGNQVSLGTKTITCNNADAVKPFGAIDTPTQGGTVSGTKFTNWGWVLTPQPSKIPIDGSTITVLVDGKAVGHPTYNKFRGDIASMFPGYANSSAAAGYFYLDTTDFTDGVHTIQWTVKDNNNNSSGIGSRFFTINNSSYYRSNAQSKNSSPRPALKQKPKQTLFHLSQIQHLPTCYSGIGVRKGLDDNGRRFRVFSDESGVFTVQAEEMERLVIGLSRNETVVAGYLATGETLRPLPIGSTLDRAAGTFYWQLSQGFVGGYRLVFIQQSEEFGTRKRYIDVNVAPKFSLEK